MKYIKSYTAQDIIDARDPSFLKHDYRVKELKENSGEPILKYCYCNTIVLEVKSSHYNNPSYVNKKTGKSTGYQLKYRIFILLEDFYTIAKDKDIDFNEAVEYALRYGDIHCRCSCPAAQYWGYNYISTQLRSIYGLPRENRPPVIRNPSMKGIICKHLDLALTYILQHKELIKDMFELYYSKFRSGQSLIAVDDTGKEVKIGTKDGNGDVFFEKQLELKELSDKEREENMKRGQTEKIEDFDVEDPTSGGVDWEDEESEESDDEDNVIE